MVPLKPDLVLVGPWDRPLTQRMLHVLGFHIVTVPLVNDVPPGVAQIREVAKLLGHPERGEALIAEIEAARKRLAAAPRPKSSSAMLVGNSGYTVGPESLAARADARGRADAAGGRARRLRRLRAAREADHAASGFPGDGERRRDAGRAGRALSHASGDARALSAARSGSCCRAATRCARARAWSRRSTISPTC